jgi:hypothetical protein|tara:strand:- start:452 stop:907 length:456 start_codon:yes stop_codon:yes gene_type:complete
MMIKVMVFIVILACAGPFFIKGPDGKPLLTIDEIMADLSPANLIPNAVKSAAEPSAPALTKVYRWQDENGVWQFSDNPNDAPGAEVMELDGKINTIESVAPQPVTKSPTAIPGVATVSPGQAAELMDTVNNLQETIDQRKADMDALSGMQR